MKNIFRANVWKADAFASGIFRGTGASDVAGGKLCGKVYAKPLLDGSADLVPLLNGRACHDAILTGAADLEECC